MWHTKLASLAVGLGLGFGGTMAHWCKASHSKDCSSAILVLSPTQCICTVAAVLYNFNTQISILISIISPRFYALLTLLVQNVKNYTHWLLVRTQVKVDDVISSEFIFYFLWRPSSPSRVHILWLQKAALGWLGLFWPAKQWARPWLNPWAGDVWPRKQKALRWKAV